MDGDLLTSKVVIDLELSALLDIITILDTDGGSGAGHPKLTLETGHFNL